MRSFPAVVVIADAKFVAAGYEKIAESRLRAAAVDGNDEKTADALVGQMHPSLMQNYPYSP